MFMGDISLIVRQMRVFAERELADCELGFPEQVILMYLMGKGVSNQEQIARFYGIDKGAIAKTVGKLEGKGYIVRKTNPENKREKLLSLAPAAQPVIASMTEAFMRWEESMFEGVDAGERAILERVIARMAQNSTRMMSEGR